MWAREQAGRERVRAEEETGATRSQVKLSKSHQALVWHTTAAPTTNHYPSHYLSRRRRRGISANRSYGCHIDTSNIFIIIISAIISSIHPEAGLATTSPGGCKRTIWHTHTNKHTQEIERASLDCWPLGRTFPWDQPTRANTNNEQQRRQVERRSNEVAQ